MTSQICIKYTTNKNRSLSNYNFIFKIFKNPLFLVSYILSFINILIWILILKENSLSKSTFILSLLHPLFLLSDYTLFKIKVGKINLLGAFLIVLGISLLI
jgi:drug/metabolite transporter (DMT)-like permease